MELLGLLVCVELSSRPRWRPCPLVLDGCPRFAGTILGAVDGLLLGCSPASPGASGHSDTCNVSEV